MTYNPELLDKAKRHPEKQKNPDRPAGRKPEWIRAKAPQGKVFAETRATVKKHKLTTSTQNKTKALRIILQGFFLFV